MAGPGETIDAAMLAPSVGVDRPIKQQIRRSVVTQRRTRPFQSDFGRDQAVIFRDFPAIVERDPPGRLIPGGGIVQCRPRARARPRQQVVFLDLHGSILEQYKNIRN
jgi:hypothetical protein